MDPPRSLTFGTKQTNKQSIGLGVIKDPEANTIEVTKDVLKQINSLEIPSSIEVVTITNDGPEIEAEIHTLEQEALFGFLFAVIIVFAFMTTLKPTVVGGLINTLRPTMVTNNKTKYDTHTKNTKTGA